MSFSERVCTVAFIRTLQSAGGQFGVRSALMAVEAGSIACGESKSLMSAMGLLYSQKRASYSAINSSFSTSNDGSAGSSMPASTVGSLAVRTSIGSS